MTYQPIAAYGQQTTLLFSMTGDAESVKNSTSFAASLRNRGQVIIVGVGPDALSNGLGDLASPGNVVSWPDLTNTDGLSDQIMKLLSKRLSQRHLYRFFCKTEERLYPQQLQAQDRQVRYHSAALPRL